MTDSKWPEIDVLEQLTTPRRLRRIDRVLADRIGSVTAVFEDLYDPRNVSAGMRTCEAYGIADVHVVSDKNAYQLRGDVAASAERWLDVHRYGSTRTCIERLRGEGFAIWVSDLSATKTLSELAVDGKIALVVGHEHDGISDEIRAAADHRYILPMMGMVQSLNVSVALAVSLQAVMPARREQLGGGGDLDKDRQWTMRRRWLEHAIRNAKQVRQAYGEAGAESS